MKTAHIKWNLFALTIASISLLAATAGAQPMPVLSAKIAETAPIPPDQIPAYDKAAVASPERPAADRALDAGRKPEQMLAFYGVKPGMTVADIWAGGGWSTEVLARAVGPTGKVYSVNPPFPPRFKKAADQWKARLKETGMSNVVESQLSPTGGLDLPANSLDLALINMNYHDMVWMKFDRAKLNAAIFKALKPGGTYAIIDNSARSGTGASEAKTLHRIDEDFEIAEIEKAGFKLAAASSALRNPKDDRSEIVFKHRGEQDRFMLKFVKPQ